LQNYFEEMIFQLVNQLTEIIYFFNTVKTTDQKYMIDAHNTLMLESLQYIEQLEFHQIKFNQISNNPIIFF
jgi:hypothetical protein